jgi:hypothetical protein
MPTKTKKQSITKSPKKPVKKSVRSAVVEVPSPKLVSAFQITKDTAKILWNNKKLFGVITLIYGIAYLILVQALSTPTNTSSLRNEFSGVFHGHFSHLFSGLSTFAFLIGSSADSSSPSGSAYQVFIILIVSLVVIWTFRQLHAGSKVRARDGYYKALYPLIPFFLVLLFMAVQLIPLIIGATLYNLVITGGIAVYTIEKVIWILIVIGLGVLSLYFISSSIFALYIVTLPDMTPLKALRSAKGLVRKRRWVVFRKIIYLPVMLLIVIGVIMLPVILVIPAIAAWLFLILSLVALVVAHGYLYNLYRELLK